MQIPVFHRAHSGSAQPAIDRLQVARGVSDPQDHAPACWSRISLAIELAANKLTAAVRVIWMPSRLANGLTVSRLRSRFGL